MVERYVHDVKRETGHEIDLVDVDTREGVAKAELYDVVRHPTVVAATDDGQMLQVWQGEHLPTINEISGYFNR
jgi:hypothetical protein